MHGTTVSSLRDVILMVRSLDLKPSGASRGTSTWLAAGCGDRSGSWWVPGRRQSQFPLAKLHGSKKESPDLGRFSGDPQQMSWLEEAGSGAGPWDSRRGGGGALVLVLVWEGGCRAPSWTGHVWATSWTCRWTSHVG